MSQLESQILVLAGDEQQYLNWLEHHGVSPTKARFVKSEADYRGITGFRYVNPGTFWNNPVFSRDLVAYFHEHGRLLGDED